MSMPTLGWHFFGEGLHRHWFYGDETLCGLIGMANPSLSPFTTYSDDCLKCLAALRARTKPAPVSPVQNCRCFRRGGFQTRPEGIRMNAKDLAFYAGVLASEECQCGLLKCPNEAFCSWCYNRLPAELRDGLWLEIGNGFEQVYEAAVDWLN